MAVFRVNQRIKKVRGSEYGTGMTATVHAVDRWRPNGDDIEVVTDSRGIGSRCGVPTPVSSGELCSAKSADWEPIILGDAHEASTDEALLLDLSRFAELARERVS